MVLSTTKRTSQISSIVNQNQGGGSKKAGLPYIVGRDHWTGRFLRTTPPLKTLSKTMVFTRNTVRPIGNDSRIPMR